MLLLYPSCPWVCHYRVKRLLAVPTKNWRKACERVELKGKLFHDLRRTAVRNMVRAGISERVSMAISDHKTRSVFDRSDIVSQTDITEAQEKVERWRAERASINGITGSVSEVAPRQTREHCLPTPNQSAPNLHEVRGSEN